MTEYLLSFFRKNAWLIGASVCLALAYACDDELVEAPQQGFGDDIAFSIYNDSTWHTSGTASSRALRKSDSHFLIAVGKDSLYLNVVEEENNIPVIAENTDSTVTRAASLLSGTLDKFHVTAFLNNNANAGFMNGTEVSLIDGKWTYSPIKYWPHNQTDKIHFFGYAQSIGENITPLFSVSGEPETYTGSFTYSLPEHTEDNKDAEKQPDLIFAISPNQNKETNNGTVALKFQHALSAVVFKIGEVPENVTINNVTFSNVYSKGECSMKLNEDDSIDFSWTDSETKKDYVQLFNKSVSNEQEISTVLTETCFMMIPQSFADDAQLAINFTVNGRSYSLKKTLKDIMEPDVWLPNKKYTYTISLPEEVEVNVDDKVDATNKIKSDLNITNTGIAPIYVRANIIGNWVLERVEEGVTHYDVVADWKDTDGTFEWGTDGEPETGSTVRNWRKGSDGFYYYMNEIPSGASIPAKDKLFDTYTLTASAPPVAHAMLELTIAVQAFRREDLNDIWPSDITSVISTTP